jgi:hypothetical protein
MLARCDPPLCRYFLGRILPIDEVDSVIICLFIKFLL